MNTTHAARTAHACSHACFQARHHAAPFRQSPRSRSIARLLAWFAVFVGLLAATAIAMGTSLLPSTAARAQPSISGVRNLTTQPGFPASVALTVTDPNPAQVGFVGLSSDTLLIPNSEIVVSEGGTQRLLSVRPVGRLTGTATITLIAINRDGLSTSQMFSVTVTARTPTSPPGILVVPEVRAESGQLTIANVGIGDNDVTTVQLSAVPLDPLLIPPSSISFGGFDASRTIIFTPSSTRTGTTALRITATNRLGISTTQDMPVRVVPPPPSDPPVLNAQPIVITTPSMPITIDLEVQDLVDVNRLTFNILSSNPALIPQANISVTGTGIQRRLTFSPVFGQTGFSNIIVFAQNPLGRSGRLGIEFYALSPSDPPQLNLPTTARTSRNTPLTIPFTVIDALPSAVRISAASSNPALVSATGFIQGGSGINRTITILPTLNQSGASTITVTATNQLGVSRNYQIALTVLGPSAIAPVAPIRTQRNMAGSTTISFSDANPSTVRAVAATTNPALLPQGGISLTGAGSDRLLTVQPAFNQVGQGSVTVTLTNDNNFTASVDVPVTVVNPAVPPTIQPIANLTTAQNTPAIGSITLGDANPATVTLVASSSNPALIPTNNIIFSGSGANRVVTVFPAANQVGSAFITVVATNQDGLSANASFIVTVSQPAVPPTIQPILELTTQRNTPVSAQFLVGDANLATLSVTATSSNSALIPAGNVLIQGQGTQRTVTVFPLTGQTGTALITLTARNQSGLASAFTFTVRVIAPPAIGAIPTIFIAQNSTATRSLFVSDDNLATLAFAATSSNPTLIPPANVVVSGFGDSRILTITPARNQVGNTVLTLTVTNSNGLQSTVAFLVTVVAPPRLSAIPDLVTTANTPVSADFTVSDADVNSLMFRIQSSNSVLIPPGNVEVTGFGEDRTVTVRPALQRLGVSNITLTASNGVAEASRTFSVTVVAPNRTVPQPISPTTGTVTLFVDGSREFSSVDFSWIPITGAVGAVFYNVQVTTDSTFNFVPIDASLIAGSSVTLTGFEPEREYYWRVRAQVVTGGFSAWSPVYSFRTVRQRLFDLPFSATAANPAKASSGAVSEASGVSAGANASTAPQSALWQSVERRDNAITSPDRTVLLYPNAPNPFTDMTRIEYELTEPTAVQLYVVDAAGRRVADLVNSHVRGGRYSVIFSPDGLPSGAYSAVLQTPKQTIRMPMVLRR
jgi:hypothetical protein